MTAPNFRSADLWAGITCLCLGGLALWIGADYPQGNAGRIGPGYVPRLLAWLLVGLGIVMLVRSMLRHELVEVGFAWRPLLLVLGAVMAFALVFSRFGLAPAILVAVGIANFAVAVNSWRSALAVGAVLAVFAWLLFVKALGLPIPVFILSGNAFPPFHTAVVPGDEGRQGQAQTLTSGAATAAAFHRLRPSSSQGAIAGRDANRNTQWQLAGGSVK